MFNIEFYCNHVACDQLSWMSCLLLVDNHNLWYIYLQRHDIVKKRIDAHGNVIEAKKDGIGAPKVCGSGFLAFFFSVHWLHILHVCTPIYAYSFLWNNLGWDNTMTCILFCLCLWTKPCRSTKKFLCTCTHADISFPCGYNTFSQLSSRSLTVFFE